MASNCLLTARINTASVPESIPVRKRSWLIRKAVAIALLFLVTVTMKERKWVYTCNILRLIRTCNKVQKFSIRRTRLRHIEFGKHIISIQVHVHVVYVLLLFKYNLLVHLIYISIYSFIFGVCQRESPNQAWWVTTNIHIIKALTRVLLNDAAHCLQFGSNPQLLDLEPLNHWISALLYIYESNHDLLYANNKGIDQSAHPPSLISAFVIRCLDIL